MSKGERKKKEEKHCNNITVVRSDPMNKMFRVVEETFHSLQTFSNIVDDTGMTGKSDEIFFSRSRNVFVCNRFLLR